MNDFVDLTDRLNDILREYTYTEEEGADYILLDLDSWDLADLQEAVSIMQHALSILLDGEFLEEPFDEEKWDAQAEEEYEQQAPIIFTDFDDYDGTD